MSASYGHSWHQAHDQVTVLLLVPYDTLPEDVFVQIEQNYLIAGVKDHPPLIKGRTYSSLEPSTSTWQLEPRHRQVQGHERTRTTSTASTISNASSYAVVSSDPDISSSFAASLASGRQSVADDYGQVSPYPHQSHRTHSPPISSPASLAHTPLHNSRPASPPLGTTSSWASSMSSRSSLQLQANRTGRLLTLYLEKLEHVIWPSIIVGPVPVHVHSPYPAPPGATDGNGEEKFNMDAVSLGVLGVELADTGRQEEAFEYFVRAWHQTHTALSTIRLTTYLPPSAPVHITIDSDPEPGTGAYYLQRIGGLPGLARLYLEAGLLYLEGVAEGYLTTRASRVTTTTGAGTGTGTGESPTLNPAEEEERWRQERETARKLFDRARMLDPHADIPVLAPDETSDSKEKETGPGGTEFHMPEFHIGDSEKPRRRRQNKEEASLIEQRHKQDAGGDETDATWYLYLPGLIGAGTALFAVGLIGALSYGSWRKTQNS